MTPELKARIDSLVTDNQVLLFMKGNKFFPQCGFSARAVGVLQQLNVPFHTVDVLADPDIRQGIKEYGSWPTIPQLYLKGELLGGSDILMEMFESGELAKMVAPAE
jgi:monothiol glutaredoxin